MGAMLAGRVGFMFGTKVLECSQWRRIDGRYFDILLRVTQISTSVNSATLQVLVLNSKIFANYCYR